MRALRGRERYLWECLPGRSEANAEKFPAQELRKRRWIWDSARMGGRSWLGDLLFQLSQVVRSKSLMIPRLRSLLLVSAFVSSAVAAVVTHYWRERFEADFDPRPLFSVIFAQFQACRSDDFNKAYDQASTAAQAHFSLVQYATKIRSEYGRISSWKKLEFGRTFLENQRAIVEVYFLSDHDQVTPGRFTMVREGAIWRIENFEILETWPDDRRLAGFSV